MATFYPLRQTELRVASHIMVMQNFLQRQEGLSISHAKYATLKQALDAAIQKEDKDFKADQGSFITPEIAAADEKRDRLWGAISAMANTFSGGIGNDEQTTAAKTIVAIRKKFDVNVNSAIAQETAVLNQVIDEIEQRKVNLKCLNAEQLFADLKEQNTIVDRGVNSRQNDRAYIATGTTLLNRAATDMAYTALCNFLAAVNELMPSAPLTAFVTEWNSMVNYYRQNLLGKKAYKPGIVGTEEEEEDGNAEQTPSGNGGTSAQQPSTGGGSTGGQTPGGSGDGEYDA